MSTEIRTRIEYLAPNDVFQYGGESYTVVRVEADVRMLEDGSKNVLRNVHVLDANGTPSQFNFSAYQVIYLVRDDAHLNAIPSHVVIDTTDGYTYSRDSRDLAFTLDTATAFARVRNTESQRPTYVVFALTAVA